MLSIAILIVTAAVIIGGGLFLGRLFSGPETKALTEVVRAHRWGDDARKTASLDAAFEVFEVVDDTSTKEQMQMLLTAAKYDLNFGRFHHGVATAKLLRTHCTARGLSFPWDGE